MKLKSFLGGCRHKVLWHIGLPLPWLHILICLQTSENMIADVVEKAFEHAETSAKEIDAIFVGTFNNGFQKQEFHSPLLVRY